MQVSLLHTLKEDIGYFVRDGSHILFLCDFPLEWKVEDIHKNLVELMPLKIKWLDDTSCFIRTTKQTAEILNTNPSFKLLNLNNAVAIERYIQWKKTQVPKPKEHKSNFKKKVNKQLKKKLPALKPTVISTKDNTESEKLLKIINGILNKLSESNFEKLSDKIVSLLQEPIDLFRGVLKQLAKLIHDKATDDVKFVTLYVKLCAKLCVYDGFKEEFVTLCLDNFVMVEEQRKKLGNMQVIGNLYLYKLLEVQDVEKCIEKCFIDDNIELLCKLLETILPEYNITQLRPRLKCTIQETSDQRLKVLLQNVLEA
jgi:hypothetical protein